MILRTKNIKKITLHFAIYASCVALCPEVIARGQEIVPTTLASANDSHLIEFKDVPVIEFLRFVGKISEANFVYNPQDLQFQISFSTGKPVASRDVIKSLIHMLRVRGFTVVRENHNYVIHKGELKDSEGESGSDGSSSPYNRITASLNPILGEGGKDKAQFYVYKLRYHQGIEILEALKRIATDMGPRSDISTSSLLSAIQSIQWIKATNTLLSSCDEDTHESLTKLIESLDVPARQVFIEVLVVETDVRHSMDFGLQWAAGGQYMGKVGGGVGNFPGQNNPFAGALQNGGPPTGLGQIPIGNGFDIGVIGDIILHKGRTFLTLGSLVHALQIDGDSTIVLNQKIITQDNKNSKIFVGDTIPFTGSVISTIGQSQQTTANIEYRDIGVSLNITPMLGEGNIVTLDIEEQITESVEDLAASTSTVNGIRTTKTNMVTHAHVPDQHFLVLSGMVRNSRSNHRSGIPCLGGLPLIGAAFRKDVKRDEKRNVIIFVRPTIINSFDDYKKITKNQEALFSEQAAEGEFEKALELIEPDIR